MNNDEVSSSILWRLRDPAWSVGGTGGGGKATFPAYGDGEEGTAALIPTAGANTNIVHPTHDISLVSKQCIGPETGIRCLFALWIQDE